jgi:Fe-S cluster assembly scaffold protein SufB
MSNKVDALSTHKTIVESGIAEANAQAISRAIDDRVIDSVSNLATKADVEDQRISITAAFENVRLSFTAALDTKTAETNSKIADLRTAVERSLRLSIQWMAGLVFALMVTIIGAATTIILKFAY